MVRQRRTRSVTEYDEPRGTGLIQTLETYFANGANLTRAKDDLHVHVNTVAQRLDPVSQLLGDDWQEAGLPWRSSSLCGCAGPSGPDPGLISVLHARANARLTAGHRG
ncbi:helix-turn-helix domain-containing protein [Kribbella turkmenica]|uniref:helix-turn-helix domain-containing protein n=1 Tax=Kribbella turkmenica TaxID=2530375 RepID=UPI00192DC8BD